MQLCELTNEPLERLVLSHYYWVIAALQIAGGVLLLVNRFETAPGEPALTLYGDLPFALFRVSSENA